MTVDEIKSAITFLHLEDLYEIERHTQILIDSKLDNDLPGLVYSLIREVALSKTPDTYERLPIEPWTALKTTKRDKFVCRFKQVLKWWRKNEIELSPQLIDLTVNLITNSTKFSNVYTSSAVILNLQNFEEIFKEKFPGYLGTSAMHLLRVRLNGKHPHKSTSTTTRAKAIIT